MKMQTHIPREGDLHSVVRIDSHTFVLHYGYRAKQDRRTGEPYILYPDLLTTPHYTRDGYRIVTALQHVCPHYRPPANREWEDCCYTCSFYPDPRAEIDICRCLQMRMPDPSSHKEE